MRVITLLSLFFGYTGMMLLDGQVFTHAVMGIIFGFAAIGGGISSARKDSANGGRRWSGWAMAVLGLGLTVFCAVLLPSGYRTETKFNMISKEFHQRNPADPALDFHALGFDNIQEARKLFYTYKQVCMAQICEDHWEDMGPRKYSFHHFQATVKKVFKGDMKISETVSFCYPVDTPPLTVSNAFVGSNMLVLANGHMGNEIRFYVGDFFLVDTNIQQVLQRVFPDVTQ